MNEKRDSQTVAFIGKNADMVCAENHDIPRLPFGDFTWGGRKA